MESAEEEFLTQLHRDLELRDLMPDDPRYVSLEDYPEAVGPDAVLLLRRGIMRTTSGAAFFLSGLRGSGKTTQLRRLREELAREGFAAVRIDAEEYLNLRQPMDVVEFLFFLVGGISDEVDEAGWLPGASPAGRVWNGLGSWLSGLPKRVVPTEVGFEGGVELAKVNLKAEIRRDERFVAQLRRFLDGRLSELADEANRIVRDLVTELRGSWSEQGRGRWRGLVVLVDSLDHVRGADFERIRQALVDLFDKQSSTITLRDCLTVFIVPPYLQIDYGTVRQLTNIKASDRDRQPFEPGVAALREVVARRTPGGDPARLFGSEEGLRRLLAASGGNLRDLLRLVTEVEVQAEKLPVDDAIIDAACQQVRNGLLPLSTQELDCLATVATGHRAPLHSQAKWDELAMLFDRHLVLGYANGETWYDVHPLVADLVRAHADGDRAGPTG